MVEPPKDSFSIGWGQKTEDEKKEGDKNDKNKNYVPLKKKGDNFEEKVYVPLKKKEENFEKITM